MSSSKEFTAAEVNERASRGESWVIFDGSVYDVSKFAGHHPGGTDVLLAQSGRDVSQVMRSDAHKHSGAAFSLLNDMKVGVLSRSRKSCTPNAVTRSSSLEDSARTSNGGVHAGNGTTCRQNGCVTRSRSSRRANGVGVSPQAAEDAAGEVPANGNQSTVGWREEDLVDWSKPMLAQVGSLGERYDEWVHRPVDKPLRLFQSDFVEFFSRTPWYVIPAVWLPVITLLGALSSVPARSFPGPGAGWLATQSIVSPVGFAVLFVAGLLSWSLVEYVLHRFLFHMSPPQSSRFLITLHFLLHGQHHKVPFESMRLVFPPVPASIIAASFYILLKLSFSLSVTRALTAGGLLGYVCYDLTHYYLHHGTPDPGTYLHRLKSYHVHHHFVNHNTGFGISSKLWDFPFRTMS